MTPDLLALYPEWAREVHARLAGTPQIVLVGNVDDGHLAPILDQGPAAKGLDAPLVIRSTADIVADCMRSAGFDVAIRWNVVNGLSAIPDAARAAAAEVIGTKAWENRHEPSAPQLALALESVVRAPDARAGLIVDSAPRLAPTATNEHLHQVYVTAQQLSREPVPKRRQADRRFGLHNLVVWLVAREVDLPYWLIGSDGVRVISVPEPTLDIRQRASELLAPNLPRYGELGHEARKSVIKQLAEQTEGMSLTDLREIVLVAVDRGIPASEVEDAVRFLRAGVQTSPWRETAVRDRISEAPPTLNKEVSGQTHAVRKSLNALARAALGLTGAHSANRRNGPRGVLFFAGPTGVGKTELANQIARTVFGRQEAVVRFDMSEFSAEHSEARLIGAPPGFVGHDAGGELTNAVRRRPFCLLLFDEVDKAHPRILDKFLGILEDGRLTDGSGSTVYFTETFIVFTSNLGVYRRTEQGRPPELLIKPGTEYAEVDRRVRQAVVDHFTGLERPELLNRIGEDNIVVFDFISPDTARTIVRRNVGNVERSVLRQTGGRLAVSPRAMEFLETKVIQPQVLAFGGRAVGATVQSHLVNPLSWELLTAGGHGEHTVTDIWEDDEGPHVKLAPGIAG